MVFVKAVSTIGTRIGQDNFNDRAVSKELKSRLDIERILS